MISPFSRLGRVLRAALRREPAPSARGGAADPAAPEPEAAAPRAYAGGDPDGDSDAVGSGRSDLEGRIEAAQQRLKATIPPRDEDG